MLKCREPVVIPFRQHFALALRQKWNVQMDCRRLPDSVEPPDALFEQFGIQRQIEQHQVMGKLEVPALTANFGADEETGSFFLGKPGRITIPLHQ